MVGSRVSYLFIGFLQLARQRLKAGSERLSYITLLLPYEISRKQKNFSTLMFNQRQRSMRKKVLNLLEGLNSIFRFFTQLSGLSAEESQLSSLSGYRSNNSKFFVKCFNT